MNWPPRHDHSCWLGTESNKTNKQLTISGYLNQTRWENSLVCKVSSTHEYKNPSLASQMPLDEKGGLFVKNIRHQQIFVFSSLIKDLCVGNGNHSVSLPIILIKIKVDQMLTSSYISSLLVSILWFCVWFPISMNVRLYFGAKMITFCIIHIGNRKIFLKHHSPPQVPTNPFARKCVLIFYIIYVKS